MPRIRAHIRLNNQNEVMRFVESVSKEKDEYSVENNSGTHRVNAKSLLGVMYCSMDFPDEMYLVNDSNDGQIASFADAYRML